jgi:hypothetical protein
MLAGDAHYRFNTRAPTQFEHYECHLDGLWSGTENHENLDHLPIDVSDLQQGVSTRRLLQQLPPL